MVVGSSLLVKANRGYKFKTVNFVVFQRAQLKGLYFAEEIFSGVDFKIVNMYYS